MKRIAVLALAALAFCAPARAALGTLDTEVVMLKFADYADEPVTPATVQDVVFNQYRSWLSSESNGLETIDTGTVWGWYTLPHTLAYYCPIISCPTVGGGSGFSAESFSTQVVPCTGAPGEYPICAGGGTSQITFDAEAIAAQHFVPGDKALRIYVLNHYSGADTGAPIIKVGVGPTGLNWLKVTTLEHEGGHADPARLWHAYKWSCPGDVGPVFTEMLQGGCQLDRYADQYSIMGCAGECGVPAHFSAWERGQLGWIAPANVQWFAGNGLYDVYNAESLPSHPQEIRVPITTDGSYFYSVTYHADVGAFVHLHVPFCPLPGQVNSDPVLYADADQFTTAHNAPLHDGGPAFVDSYRGISVTVTFDNNQKATVNIIVPGGGGGGGGGHQR